MTADLDEVAKMVVAVAASLILLAQGVAAGGAGTALSRDRETMHAAVTSVLKEAQQVTAAVVAHPRK